MLKNDIESLKNEGRETKLMTVECPCCHQRMAVDIIPEMENDQKILTELAAEQCTCPGAQLYQQKKERMEKMETALEQSVGAKSEEPVDEETFEAIRSVAKEVCLLRLHKATIHLDKMEKITMKTDKDNFLIIEREKKEVKKKTV